MHAALGHNKYAHAAALKLFAIYLRLMLALNLKACTISSMLNNTSKNAMYNSSTTAVFFAAAACILLALVLTCTTTINVLGALL